MMREYTIEEVKDYWNSHLNLTQFLTKKNISVGSDQFFSEMQKSMKRFTYKEELLKDFAQECKGQKLLEIGCGLGLELTTLGELGYDVTGVDLAPAAVELTNAYLRRKNVTGRALVENAEQLSYPDESFDAVYSSGVIQHTPDINKAISEIWRVLRPGGKILIILYHRHSWFYLLQKISGTNIEFEDQDAPIINTYTRKEMKSLFSQFRNVSVSVEYYRPKPTKRTGALPFLFNKLFVNGSKLIPSAIMKNFGWHLILTGIK